MNAERSRVTPTFVGACGVAATIGSMSRARAICLLSGSPVSRPPTSITQASLSSLSHFRKWLSNTSPFLAAT